MHRLLTKLKPVAAEPRREPEPPQRVRAAAGDPPAAPRRRVLNEAAHKLHH